MKKRIVLTGGGTAGHVTPNIALVPYLLRDGWEIHYLGTEEGIERKLIEQVEGVAYHPIQSGRFRRYFTWKNFTDPFKVIRGMGQSKRILRELKPRVLFSKGGFVSVPVVFGAKSAGVPVVLHESDYTAGLANKLSAPKASVICTSFDPKELGIAGDKAVWTGSPIRDEITHGNAARARTALGFDQKPVLLFMGGSQGSAAVNAALEEALGAILMEYSVIHVRGKGNLNPSLTQQGYKQFEYVDAELADYFALCDLMIGRAGANTIFELLCLMKPSVLIPLPKEVSRGDQILNARYFQSMNYGVMLEQKDLTPESLISAIHDVYRRRGEMAAAMEKSPIKNGTINVLRQIYRAANLPFPFEG